MNHYIRIKILSDPDFAPTLLMNALYSKLHRVLVQLKSTEIGVSFPEYTEDSLGKIIRLHSSNQNLEALMKTNWLTGMHDHILVDKIRGVPPHVEYVVFRRIQAKSSAERIRRRHMLRHKLDYHDTVKLIPNTIEQRLQLPFITLKSSSTEQNFRFFIKKEEQASLVKGNFNTYGLSKDATVPLF